MSSIATSFSQKVSIVDSRVSNTENRVGNRKSTGPKYRKVTETLESTLEQTRTLCNELEYVKMSSMLTKRIQSRRHSREK